MSKAIAGAVEIAAGIVLEIVPGGQLLGTALIMTGIATEAGAIAQALGSDRGMGITTRTPAAFRQIIRGTQRVGGTLVYQSTTGSSKRQYNMVIVLAGHPCYAITDLYLDGRRVIWQVGSRGNVTMPDGTNFGGHADPGTYYGPNGVAYTFGSEVFCFTHMGTETASTVDNSDLFNNDSTWAPTTQGTPYLGGCTWVYLKLEADTGTFPQFPEIRFTVKGKCDILDPRTGTRGYTTNWALHVADAITDAQFGLGDDSVNTDQLIAAANVCDEQVESAAGLESRYALNWTHTTGISAGDAIAQMMDAAAGRLCRIGGEWWIFPAYWQGPSFTCSEDDLASEIQWMPKRPLAELSNRVQGTYTAPNYPYNVAGDLYDAHGYYDGQVQNNFPFAFQASNFPMYACDQLHGYGTGVDVYLTEDGGIYLPMDISLPGVLSIAQAQRVAKIKLLRNRQQGSGMLPFKLSAWKMQTLDVLEFNSDVLSWVSKQLEIAAVRFKVTTIEGQDAPACMLEMTVQETDPSVYEWASGEELTPYDVPVSSSGYSYITPTPTNLTIEDDASTEILTSSGVIIPRLLISWTPPNDTYVNNGGRIEVQYQFATAAGDPQPTILNPAANPDGSYTSDWVDAGAVSGQASYLYIQGIAPYRAITVRVRSVRSNGGVSDWVQTSQYSYGRSTGLPVAPVGTLTGQAFSDGTAQISIANFTATLGGLSAACAPSPNTLSGLHQGQFYEVYYIDATFAGGSITPIATQNVADYTGKSGYYLIGSITTPTYVPRYRPSMSSDLGTEATGSPESAYDNRVDTYAAVVGAWSVTGVGDAAETFAFSGDCLWSGFPAVVSTSALTLKVLAAALKSSAGTVAAAISATISGTTTTLASLTDTAAQQIYTLAVPVGTNLSSITVEVTAAATPRPSGNGAMEVDIFEIWIE